MCSSDRSALGTGELFPQIRRPVNPSVGLLFVSRQKCKKFVGSHRAYSAWFEWISGVGGLTVEGLDGWRLAQHTDSGQIAGWAGLLISCPGYILATMAS